MTNKFDKIDEALNVESSIVNVKSEPESALDVVNERNNDKIGRAHV